MANILVKHGDNTTKAITYIDEKLRTDPRKRVSTLISEAGSRFNLTPKDEEYLARFFKERDAQNKSGS